MSKSGYLKHAPAEAARPCGLNTRRRFDDEKQRELVASVRENEVIEPILATSLLEDFPGPDGDGWDDEVELLVVAGERRWRAAQEVADGDSSYEIPFIVRKDLDRKLATKLILVENIQRSDLTPMEEAWGIQQWYDEEKGLTQEQMAEALGVSQSWVSNRMRLLQLSVDAQEAVQQGKMTASQARDLLLPFQSLRDDDVRETLYDAVAGRLFRMQKDDDEFPLPPDDLRKVIAEEAKKLSKPLEGWVRGERGRQFPMDDHDDCGCGGPPFVYGDKYTSKCLRCFDVEWWEEHQEAALEALEAEQEDGEEAVEKLPWGDTELALEQNETQRSFGYNLSSRLVHLVGGKATLADPDELDPDDLLLVETPRGGRYAVVCRDEDALQAAREAASEALDQRRDTVERRRLEEDLKAIQGMSWQNLLAPMVARTFTTDHWPFQRLAELATHMGAGDLPEDLDQHHDVETWRKAFLEWLYLMDDAAYGKVLAVWALRIGRGDYGQWGRDDPAREQAAAELHREYISRLQEIFPFELPEPEEEEEDPVEALVLEAVQEEPAPTVETIYGRAQEKHPEIVDRLSIRQFNARYVLQAKRALARRED